ncbi:hypothetical protein GJ496_001126 [Pomphorhynchus laevis]|nr:hypothetical protein GJ496_001126 [Pomphorhynchus laevis]
MNQALVRKNQARNQDRKYEMQFRFLLSVFVDNEHTPKRFLVKISFPCFNIIELLNKCIYKIRPDLYSYVILLFNHLDSKLVYLTSDDILLQNLNDEAIISAVIIVIGQSSNRHFLVQQSIKISGHVLHILPLIKKYYKLDDIKNWAKITPHMLSI